MSESVLPAVVDAAPLAADQAALADEARVLAPRRLVPSRRQVELGHKDYTFEAPPRVETQARRGPMRVVGDSLHDLNFRRVTQGGPILPLVFVALFFVFGAWDDYAFNVNLKEIRSDLGFDLGFIFVIGGLVNLTQQLISPLMGYVADRVRRTAMFGIGAVVGNLSSVGGGFASTGAGIAAARAGAGLGGALAAPAAQPLLADWYSVHARARVYAVVGMANTLGLTLGPLVGGAIGQLLGWRAAMISLGILATLVSVTFFFLKEPVRGAQERRELLVDTDSVLTEQKPVGWAEGWRTVARINTVRSLWFTAPFTFTSASVALTIMPLYYAQEFGVTPLGRGVIGAAGGVAGMLGLMFAGPLADRLLAVRPGRVFTALAGVLTIVAAATVVLALSPSLWLSIAASIPLGIGAGLLNPALVTLISLVLPARVRGFGLQTLAPWQVLGYAGVVLLGSFNLDIRTYLLVLVPMYGVAAAIFAAGAGGVQRDIRSALAASVAEDETKRARLAGRSKMIVCRDIEVEYDGTKVLHGVDFDVEAGELVALLGTNGAGKTTLMKAIAGIEEATNGVVFLDGRDITHRPPHMNARDGVVFMPGGRGIFPNLSVEENLRAAAWMQREDENFVRESIDRALENFPELRSRLGEKTGNLSGGEQQMVALSQALLMKPRLLMIDELSLGLAPAVVERLLEIVRQINDAGTTVILVEQSVNVALTLAGRSVFMDKGEIHFDGPTEDLLRREDLVRSVFLAGAGGGGGGAFVASGSGLRRAAWSQEREQVLAAEGLVVRFGGLTVLNGVHLDLAGSEVLGIIGPNGAGKTTLFDTLSGYVKAAAGTVLITGQEATDLPPYARARLGLGRSFQNARLFPSLTVRENVAVALEQHLAVRNVVLAAAWAPTARRSEKRAFRRVNYLLELLNLEDFGDKFVNELSTGTRRMVDIACIMASEPRVLLLDEPSSGLAQAEVEVLAPVIRRLAKETGCGVLVIEHDIPLVRGLSDRMMAMVQGQVIVEGSPSDVVNDKRIVEAYLGASQATINRSGALLAPALAALGLEKESPR